MKTINTYWDDGSLKSKYYIKGNNEKNGKEILYYRNGNVNRVSRWVNNELQGNSTVFYRSNNRYIDMRYKNGELDGVYTVYAENGEIMQKYVFKGGLLISSNSYNVSGGCVAMQNNNTQKKVIDDSLKSEFDIARKEYEQVREEEEAREEEKNQSGVVSTIKKVGKTAVGVQGIQDRRSSKRIKEASEKLFNSAFRVTESIRLSLNAEINDFGINRLNSLKSTTGRFLGMLRDMNQNSAIKEYDVLDGFDIDIKIIEQMESIDMSTSKAIGTSLRVGGLGAAAAMGTPALVTGAVSTFATASTGTAISSLSGAAATNATLAWLGGGSIAAGGGGMAAGATVLSTLTIGATAGVGLLAAGFITSTYYSKKLTETKEYQKEVEINVANVEKDWVVLEGINKRVCELNRITEELKLRISSQLVYMEPLTLDFLTTDNYYNSVFQKTAILAKSMSDLAQVPLLDSKGGPSIESENIIEKTYKVINTELINHG